MADLLLWVDLESSGSDETKDCIIEVGAILTSTGLGVLGEFQSNVEPTAEGLGRLMQNPVVRAMHESNGLLAELLGPMPTPKAHEVAKRMLEWLAHHDAKQGHVVLAGSGVGHFDRRFIARYLPQIDRFCRYWCIDVGVIRRAHEMWVGTEVSRANEGKTHRALDDIRCHLEEARAFKALWNDPRIVTAALWRLPDA